MKKLLFYLSLPILLMMLISCSASSAPGLEGYVVKIENNRILVVSAVSKDYSASGGKNEFYEAIWFSNVPKNVEIGDKVQVWYDSVRESYPGQSVAQKVKIMPDNKPQNTKITESEAIRKALAKIGPGIPAIKDAKYDQDGGTWKITIHLDDDDSIIEIPD